LGKIHKAHFLLHKHPVPQICWYQYCSFL